MDTSNLFLRGRLGKNAVELGFLENNTWPSLFSSVEVMISVVWSQLPVRSRCLIGLCSSGVSATYISWALAGMDAASCSDEKVTKAIMSASLAACTVMRGSSVEAFRKAGRGMGAGDIMHEITAVAKGTLGA